MNRKIKRVTERIIERSRGKRQRYLEGIEAVTSSKKRPSRFELPLSSLAHELAASLEEEKRRLKREDVPNIAIISAYNDLLSAHEPLRSYPELIKGAIWEKGGVCQFAGGVPAMCDGITQGCAGMELSLMSRDVIAMSTAIALSHNCFDGALLLGVCDKIMPGLLMGALKFGHLPMILVPAGPMKSGLPNREKARARELFAIGKIDENEMLEYELKAYHSPGTCTFYGTANSNQLMAEMLGLHLPGASFVNASTPLRDALTKEAAERVLELAQFDGSYAPIGHVVSEKSIVNAIVGLMATGGSTNETMHLVAIARAAGIILEWDDFSDISDEVPQICRIYPNGPEDINAFQKAGGMAYLFKELSNNGLLNEDCLTVYGNGIDTYFNAPVLEDGKLFYEEGPTESKDTSVLTTTSMPFDRLGGLKVLKGNLGQAVMKISALKDREETFLEEMALIFESQQELEKAFREGRLYRNFIAVVRFQGPRANGMPELHKLITFLSIIMDKGFSCGLLTDGRLSGASGKVPFAIHLTPEAQVGGPISRLRDGDVIRMDAKRGTLDCLVGTRELMEREPVRMKDEVKGPDLGRSIFSVLRRNLSGASQGASAIFTE